MGKPLFWAWENGVPHPLQSRSIEDAVEEVNEGRHIVDWPPVDRTADIVAEDGTVVAAAVEVASRHRQENGLEP